MGIESPIDSKLPYGEELKALLVQNEISESFVQKTLKSKGIFFGKQRKEDTIPLLCAGILSPNEYERIKSHRIKKEDNIKRKSELLTWSSDKSLLDGVSQISIHETYQPEYDNFRFIGDPQFFPVNSNPNHLIYEYEIESFNLNDSWSEKKKTYKASIEIRVNNNDIDLIAISNHTSKDTDKINKTLIKTLKDDLNKKGLISSKENKIIFSFFSNEERIKFFWSLTGGLTGPAFSFKKITEIDVKPDELKKIPSNLDISWMEKKISKIHLNGEEIQSTFFIKDQSCHPYLIIWKMQAYFRFSIKNPSSTGHCKVNFEFYNFSRSNNDHAEFGIDINTIDLDTKYRNLSISKVKKALLEELDSKKVEIFKTLLP